MNYDDERKDLNAQKLNIIQFQNGKVLTVQAGMAQPAALTIQRLQEIAGDVRIENSQSVERVFSEAMRSVKKTLIGDMDLSDQKTKDYVNQDFGFSFLVGYYIGGKPFLGEIKLHDCTLWPVEKKDFASIGIGNHLADYLLKEYHVADADFGCGDQIAVSVIKKVKDNVKFCGGKTQIGIVFPSLMENFECNADICPDGFVNLLELNLKAQENDLLKTKNAMLLSFSRAVDESFRAAWEKGKPSV